MEIFTTYHSSPLGELEISATENYLTSILFVDAHKKPSPRKTATEYIPQVILSFISQIDEYFLGKRQAFNLTFQHKGTDFQRKVWQELENIPYGKTISYLELSRRIGNEKAIRSVGTSNGLNQFNIIVPCHRVIGSNGDLIGYGGDLWRKKWLLAHEARILGNYQTNLFENITR